MRDGKVLLVHEVADAGYWTLPGGWADVNEAPSRAIEREILEESGYETSAVQLLAVYDRDQQGHSPPHPYHVYKLFFRCELRGGEARPNAEADQIGFFDPEQLPPLSKSRVLEKQIRYAVSCPPDAPAVFD
jgi:ADP-ribose pyrophosphatase YjhB (NUDIX family)